MECCLISRKTDWITYIYFSSMSVYIGLLPLHSCCIYFGYAVFVSGFLQFFYSRHTWGALPWLRCLLIRGEDWWWQLKDWISPLTESKRAERLCLRQKNLVCQFFRTFTNSDSLYYMLILLYVPVSTACTYYIDLLSGCFLIFQVEKLQ